MVYGDESMQYFPSIHCAYTKELGKNQNFTGAKVYGETVALFFRNCKYTIPIASVEAIVYRRQKAWPFKKLLTLKIGNGSKVLFLAFPQVFMDLMTFSQFVAELIRRRALLNYREIQLDAHVQALVSSQYVYSETIRFDFAVHRSGRQGQYIINSTANRIMASRVYLFICFLFFAGVPLLGNQVLHALFGPEVPFYRLECVTLAGCALVLVTINLFLALRSQYKGHILTACWLLLAAALAVIAFV